MAAKRTFPAAEQSAQRAYRLLTASVAPRMIGWVSSRSAEGVDNLAPYSAFTIVSSRPPMIGFTSFGVKDTVRNVRETGEFTVTVATPGHVGQVNETASNFPPHRSEFVECGIAAEPSVFVAPPRPASAQCTLECRLHQIVEFGDGHFVVGEVLGWVIDADVIEENHPEGPHPRPQDLRPLSKLGVDEWATLGDVFRMARPDYNRSQA
ncbi:flavin reductase family protein [Propionicicella superfundia]|uniref:flavin reductase family protein n=1 Tax=Propionicicella superfundia TaxID=348582 RepID=UPI000560AF1F|nr:flavin reductase family protein [Propionicicella superfundia]